MSFSVQNFKCCVATLLAVNLLSVCAAADNNEEAIEIARKPLSPELIGLADSLLKVDTKKNQNPIVGCWQEVRDPTHLIRFEADRNAYAE